jgi:tight adherence protein B
MSALIGALALAGAWWLGVKAVERLAAERVSGQTDPARVDAAKVARSRRRFSRRRSLAGPGEIGRLAGDLASSLRTGHTLAQGFEEASADPVLGDDLGPRVSRVLGLRAVGVPLERAVGELAGHPASREAVLLVTLLRVGRRAGAGLPALLEEFAASMRERADEARSVRSLTVQARMSGTILCLLPIGFFAFVALTSARDVFPVLLSPAGAAVVVGGLLMQGLGALWVHRIVRVEP